MEDKTQKNSEKEDYYDESNLAELMNDSFFINYLIMNTIDKDREEPTEITKEEKKETQKIIISKMLEKVMSMDSSLSMNDVKEMVGEKFAIIKYKKQASMQEIQKTFNTHIEKYMKKIN